MINFYIEHVKGDKYLNFLAGASVEIPAYAIGGVLIYFFGIRISLYAGACISILGGSFLIVYGGEENGVEISSAAYMFLVLSAKGGILILVNAVYIGTATIFPPIFSGTAFGICNTFAKTCAIAGPMIAELEPPTPMILFTTLTAFILPSAFFLKLRKSADSFTN